MSRTNAWIEFNISIFLIMPECLRIAGLPPLPVRGGPKTWCFATHCVHNESWPREVLNATERVAAWVRNSESSRGAAQEAKAWCIVGDGGKGACSRSGALGSSWQPMSGSASADALRQLVGRHTERFAGMIFVGDSQLREIAWGMQWLLRRAGGWQKPVFHRDTSAQAAYTDLLQSGCTPEFLEETDDRGSRR